MDRETFRRRIAQRPNAVSFDDLRKLLEWYGWAMIRASGTSHHVFGKGGRILAIPYRRPHVLPVYVKQALKFIAEEERGSEA